MPHPADGRHPQSALITDARSGSSAEFSSRQRNYMITMGVRTLLFLGSVILYFTGVISLLVCGILFVAGLLLPTVAVAAANEANTRTKDQVKFESVEPTDAPQLTVGPEPEIFEGTVEDEYRPVAEPAPQQTAGRTRQSDHPSERGAA